MTGTLDVRDLSVRFGDRVGLTQLSFTLQGGECLAVLGTSGAGKSSLLRTIAGLQAAGRGTVRVNGRDVSALPPEQRGIVYLHQEPVLFPHLSVMRNVAFPLTLRGVPTREAERRAIDMLTRLRVGELAGNRPDALSGGQRHRVALARALCADPAVLLLDEPLSSLDPAVRGDVRAALLQAREVSGAATILVTHDLDDAMAVATQVSAIGRFAELSTPTGPAELLHAPPSLDVAQLLGVYATLGGVVERGSLGIVFRWIGGVLPAADAEPGTAVACIRAHELEVRIGDQLHAPVLTVVARRDAAQYVVLDVRDVSGAGATLRTSSGTVVQLGDQVQVVVHHARIFAAH
jgi:ABC-type sulfate/molybdate transport systems ATPase subunit